VTCFFAQKHALQEKLSRLVECSDLYIFFFFKEKHFLQGALDLDFQNYISKPYITIFNMTNFQVLSKKSSISFLVGGAVDACEHIQCMRR